MGRPRVRAKCPVCGNRSELPREHPVFCSQRCGYKAAVEMHRSLDVQYDFTQEKWKFRSIDPFVHLTLAKLFAKFRKCWNEATEHLSA